ncbi:MAG TPA: 16S rRNA (guanine(966)-N(2))-methyltransferase RsmD [Thermotogota bacterium]|nr:16S rRNA (guanine(966)-N(2))-methyltransferase RsmD [Thermotogota bacterium]
MQTLSIIAGIFKNHKIELVEDARTRYTPAKVKNAVFSILESRKDINGSMFLDLCAGSGQMGFEALSRGASLIHFVDISSHSIKTLKNNVQKLMVCDQVRLFKKDVIRFLSSPPQTYDLIFIDPPFTEILFNKIVRKLLETDSILKDNGRIIVESEKGFSVDHSDLYELEDAYLYSSIKIEIFKRKEKIDEHSRC